ncbi:hypothetical protein EON80_11660 [bacterium]|nr:MAG: hypothetical protein EON80_11660 [bacterium]
MKRKSVWLAIIVLLVVPLWLVDQKRKSSASYVLSRYPQSPAFDFAVQEHLKYKYSEFQPGGLRPINTTFRATWFLNGQLSVQMYTYVSGIDVINPVYSGRNEFGTRGYLFAMLKSTGRGWKLPESQFLKVKSLLTQLPSSSTHIPQSNLLIVTFNRGATYETCLYDRADLPPAVREIYKITGAPIQELGK